MFRLARYDVTRRFANPWMRAAAQVGFGLLCAAAIIAIIKILQIWIPLSGPFAFVFPAVVIATLYGQWPAGIVALVATIFAIWHLIVPSSVPISFTTVTDANRALTAGIIGSVLLLLAETFRSSVARAAAQRDREIERREMLLRELEHRTRNNFALVASLLEFQRRRSETPEIRRALDQAISRVHTFADAYSQLDSSTGETSEIDMKPYLSRLIERVADALFVDQSIRIESDIAALTLPSKKAVAIGLYLNEALTNCAKYAFPDGRAGTVRIVFCRDNAGWRLTVQDDGIGDKPADQQGSERGSGLGGILFEALATQAGAKHEVTLPGIGRRLDLVSAG